MLTFWKIFPLPRTPTVVIIKNGELKEYITPGLTKEEFVRRVQNAFSAAPAASQANAASTQAPPPTYAASQEQAQQPQRDRSDATPAAPQADRSENVQRVLAERAARLQAQKEEAERKAKEERAKALDKAKSEAQSGVDTDAARAYKQAELVKKKKQRDREERERILKRIEDDKAERRQKAAEREKQRVNNQKIGDVAAALVNAPETKLPSTTRRSELTSLQVRLFDGSTMRSRFKTNAPLADVRRWVDEKRPDGNLPYSFKQVLTPLPNKSIDATEESKDLGELGLAPSSTLVLVPVHTHANAYHANGPGNIFSRILRMILGFLAVILGLFGLGGERRAESGEGSAQDQGSSTSRDDPRVQGFGDLNNRRRDQQLYNGNSVSKLRDFLPNYRRFPTLLTLYSSQLNFEPRPDEEGQ